MAFEMNILLFGILISSLSLFVHCDKNSPINVSSPKLGSSDGDNNNNYDKDKSSVTSFGTPTISKFSGKDEIVRSMMTTAKPTDEWFGSMSRKPSALHGSKSELSSSSKETKPPFTDLSMEFTKNSTQNADVAEVSCICVPYYKCDSKQPISDPQQFQNDNPKTRLKMENCSNMSVLDVCCLISDLSKVDLNSNNGSTHRSSTHILIDNATESIKASSSMTSTETTTHFIDFLLASMRNTNQTEIELSCTCVPYYLCDSEKSILDPYKLQNNDKTPKIRLEMDNCSNMSFIDVCCLQVQESFGNRSMRKKNAHSSSDFTSTTVTIEETTLEWDTTTEMESSTSFDDFLTELLGNSSQQDVVLDCTCAPYYRCDPSNIIVPQLQNDAVFPKVRVEMENCSRELSEVCCLKNSTIIVDSKTGEADEKAADRCGIRNVGGIGNQTSAVDSYSDYGEFPWVAAILVKSDNNRFRYHCAGSVVDRNVILTSAHCIAGRNKSDIKIRVGEWDTRNSDEFFSHHDHLTEKIIIHKGFNPKNLHNDIAIIILKQPLNYHIHIGRICLPQFNAKTNQFPTNATCFSTGWGKHSFDSESLYHVVPKKAVLRVIEHNECQEQLRQTRLSKHFNLHESFICAQDNDTCSGDGGSPLMCSFDSEPGVYQLVGMVAWGLGCGALRPSVYVDVAHFRTWISDELDRATVDTVLA